MLIFGISYVILLISAAMFMHRERGAYQEIKGKYDLIRTQNSDLLKRIVALEANNAARTVQFHALQAEMDDVQLHCAKLRSQQQLIDRDNSIIKKQLVPIQVDVKLPAGALNGVAKPAGIEPMKEFKKKAKSLAKSAKSKGLM